MQKGMLVMVLAPDDPQLFDITQDTEPVFGIVEEVLDSSGQYQSFRCRVRCENGATAIYQIGRLAELLELSEQEALLKPSEAFARLASKIVKRKVLVNLPRPQRDFLKDLLMKTK